MIADEGTARSAMLVPRLIRLEKRRCLVCRCVTSSQRAAKEHPDTEECRRRLAIRAENERRKAEQEREIAARKPFTFGVTVNAANLKVAETALREWLAGGDTRVTVEAIAHTHAFGSTLFCACGADALKVEG